MSSSVVAAEGGRTAAQVAAEIVAVQAQADDVAAEWVQRDDDAKQLGVDVANSEQAVGDATATVKAMEATLTKLAVDRYTGSATTSILPFSAEIMSTLQRSVLSEFASNSGTQDLDAYRAAETDLHHKQQALNTLQRQNTAALSKLADTQATLDTKLADLQALETQLSDQEVKRAYEAKLTALRTEQQAVASAARATLEAQPTVTAPVRGGAAPVPVPTSRPVNAPVPAIASPPATTPNTTATAAPATTSASTSARSTPPTTPGTAPPATPAPPTPTPAPAPAPQAVIGGLVCPVAGPNAFGDTWGAPRAGGKRHEGVDMMSPEGTPLVAVIDGTAKMETNTLGGNAIGLKGSDGNYYYYAHLSRWEGPSRPVSQGEVIGYVGHTGDTSANHLHFGIYAGGGPAINPYPVVRRIC